MTDASTAVECMAWYCQMTAPIATMITGVIALAGVIAGLVANHMARNSNLAHDREQRRIERDYRVRQEVYLELAMATTRLFAWIANFSSVDIKSLSGTTPITEFAALSSRAKIVASFETVCVVDEAMMAILSLYRSVVFKRLAMENSGPLEGERLMEFVAFAASESFKVQRILVPVIDAFRRELEMESGEHFRKKQNEVIDLAEQFVKDVANGQAQRETGHTKNQSIGKTRTDHVF